MRRAPACLLLLLSAAPAWPQASRLELPKPSLRAEDRLRLWLGSAAGVREKLRQARTPAAPAVFAEPGLKDALADAPSPDPRSEILSRLPGLRRPRPLGCPSAAACAVPPLALDIGPDDSLEAAVRALLRPWLWLAEARGRRVAMAAPAADSRVLEMSLPGWGPEAVGLNAAPRPEGGFHLWFDRAFELTEAYARAYGASGLGPLSP